MNLEMLELLRCPVTGQRLNLDSAAVFEGGRIRSGWLVSVCGQYRYPIREFIPRFVPETNYADNFGMQWNKFRKTQLDSHTGHPISANRFWAATGWTQAEIAGRWVLDVGCGAGRFAEVALGAGSKVVAVDYSSAVDACYSNLKLYEHLNVIQADVYALPFPNGVFPFIYSLGVLQHTPDVERAFAALPPKLATNGHLCVDFYWKRFRTMMHGKYVLRPVTKRIPKTMLFRFLELSVPVLLPFSQLLGRVPMLGQILKRFVPIADYTNVYPLSPSQLREWALLDTFDMLAPQYDNPQTSARIKLWLENAGLVGIEVFHSGHLVGRGSKG